MISSSSTTRMEALRRMAFLLGPGGARRPLEWRGRKFKHEARALADHAFAVDRAMMLAHDAVGDGQTKARAVADRLGGEERVVNPGEVLARDTRPGIR